MALARPAPLVLPTPQVQGFRSEASNPTSPLPWASGGVPWQSGTTEYSTIFNPKDFVAKLLPMSGKPPNHKPIVVTIKKADNESGLGLVLDVTKPGLVMVCHPMRRGPVAKHNRKVDDKEKHILPGDYITRINDVTCDLGVAAMFSEVLTGRFVEVEVYRPRIWEVVIEKSSDTEGVGLRLHYELESRFPVVKRVAHGAARRFNEQNPEFAIMPRDRVLSVNGQTGEASIITCCLLSTQQKITLVLSRPSGGQLDNWIFDEGSLVSENTFRDMDAIPPPCAADFSLPVIETQT